MSEAHSIIQTRHDLKTDDGIVDCYTLRPLGNRAWPAALFYMDALGISPDLFAMAERLAAQGYFVMLPNLYYRSGNFPPFHAATVFKDEPERNRLMSLLQSITNEMVMRDTAVFLDFLDRETSVQKSKIGCVGYCMGGRFALLAAGTYPDRVAAAACFHGGRLATDKPDSPHLLAGKIQARVYIGVAGLDANFTLEEKERLTAALAAAGVCHTLEVYPDVRHGFAVQGSPVFDLDASERHWEKLLGLFREEL